MTTDEAAAATESGCDIDELRTLFLFEGLTPAQLEWLCAHGHVESVDVGPVFTEGDPALSFYVLLEGEVVLSRRVGVDDIEVNRTSDRGVYAGAFMAYVGDRVPQTYNNSLRVTQDARFFVLDAARFAELMNDWFPMAVHLLEGLFFGVQNSQQMVGQRERLLALGSLTAGLTHELNNPAAAAIRGRRVVAGTSRDVAGQPRHHRSGSQGPDGAGGVDDAAARRRRARVGSRRREPADGVGQRGRGRRLAGRARRR